MQAGGRVVHGRSSCDGTVLEYESQDGTRHPIQRDHSLHCCKRPGCDGVPVVDLRCEELATGCWLVLVFCRSCNQTTQGIYTEASVDKFERSLERYEVASGEFITDGERARVEDFRQRLQSDEIMPIHFAEAA